MNWIGKKGYSYYCKKCKRKHYATWGGKQTQGLYKKHVKYS